jgi:predicted Fe-Mo cluster-binding NifX family protein
MDTALRLVVAESVNGQETSRTMVDIPQAGIAQRAGFLAGLEVDVLICGAISHPFERLLAASGVRVNPWVGGDVNEIISAHMNGNLQKSRFFLPGCGRGRGRRRHMSSTAGRPRRRGRGRFNTFEEDL